MRPWIAIMLAGCHPPAHPAATPPQVASPPAAASPAVARCPDVSGEARPGVHVYPSVAAAAAAVRGDGEEPVDLAALVGERGPALFVEVPRDYFHESATRRYDLDAVFVSQGRAIVVERLADTAHPIPPTCGNGRGNEGVAIRIADLPADAPGHIGHLRILRAGVAEPPTLPPQPGGAPTHGERCDEQQPYRIEDHFIDLDAGAHLRAYTQVFTGAIYGPAQPLPGVAFDAFTVTANGVAAGECAWFWDE